MAHYDCRDCGASMGIAYGICATCTPSAVYKSKADLRGARERAAATYDDEHEEERDRYIENRVSAYAEIYQKLYDSNKPK